MPENLPKPLWNSCLVSQLAFKTYEEKILKEEEEEEERNKVVVTKLSSRVQGWIFGALTIIS